MAHVGIEGEAHGATVREEQAVNRKQVEGLGLCRQGVCEVGWWWCSDSHDSQESEFLSYAELFLTKGEWARGRTHQFIRTKANEPQACLGDGGSPQRRSAGTDSGLGWQRHGKKSHLAPARPVNGLCHHPPQVQGGKDRKDLSSCFQLARNETVQSSVFKNVLLSQSTAEIIHFVDSMKQMLQPWLSSSLKQTAIPIFSPL